MYAHQMQPLSPVYEDESENDLDYQPTQQHEDFPSLSDDDTTAAVEQVVRQQPAPKKKGVGVPKRKRDTKAKPAKRPTEWNIFLAEKTKEYKAKYPKLQHPQIRKLVSDAWQQRKQNRKDKVGRSKGIKNCYEGILSMGDQLEDLKSQLIRYCEPSDSIDLDDTKDIDDKTLGAPDEDDVEEQEDAEEPEAEPPAKKVKKLPTGKGLSVPIGPVEPPTLTDKPVDTAVAVPPTV